MKAGLKRAGEAMLVAAGAGANEVYGPSSSPDVVHFGAEGREALGFRVLEAKMTVDRIESGYLTAVVNTKIEVTSV